MLYFFEDSKSLRVPKSHYWFKSYDNFDEWADFAFWWNHISGGSAINGATPSSSFRFHSVLYQVALVLLPAYLNGLSGLPYESILF